MAAIDEATCAGCNTKTMPLTVECIACKDGLDPGGTPSPTSYCSTTCQHQHSTQHERECRSRNIRKRLYRAGELLQDIFYDWREVTHHTAMRNIRREGTKTLFSVKHSAIRFVRLPNSVQKGSNEWKALLSYRMCCTTPEFFYELTDKLLKGIATTIEQVRLKLKKGHYIAVNRNDPQDYLHDIVAIETTDGNSYILDLTGAQIGNFEAVVPLETYMSRFGARVKVIWRQGYALANFQELLKDRPWDRIFSMHHELYKTLNKTVVAWEVETRRPVSTILEGKRKDFLSAKSAVADLIRLKLRTDFDNHARNSCLSVPESEIESFVSDDDMLNALNLRDDTGTGIFRRWLKDKKAYKPSREEP